jgi:hypothetical protein
MASERTVDLAVRISADVSSEVDAQFAGVGDAASRMASDVDSSTGKAAAGIDRMGSASEGLDDKFGRAAGAAGALSSGADLIGNEKASVALQAMALATDFFSGVGQVGILVTEGLSGAQSENIIVSKAQAAATKASAVAQGALNAVMEANPILLVVLAIAALALGFKLAWDHSEKFRAVVQATGRVAGAALGFVVDIIGDIVDWLGRTISKFGLVGDAVHAYVFLVKAEIGLVVDILKFVVDKVGDAGHAWGEFKDKAVEAAHVIADRVGDFFRRVFAPIDAARDVIKDVIDLIDDLLDKISHIHVPHVDVNPFDKTAGGRPTGASQFVDDRDVNVNVAFNVAITLPVAGDPSASADAIAAALREQADRLGVEVADVIGNQLAAA